VISRHGRPIARISPEPEIDGERVRQAIEGMKALRKKIGRLTLEEILSARDEGRE
jgi:antitoxin (DNA-binding transcriptional repressor) of toxin-antitoxin stability system